MKSQLEKELQQVIFHVFVYVHRRLNISCVALSCIENVMKLIYFQEWYHFDAK